MKTVPIATNQKGKPCKQVVPVYTTYNQWGYTFHLVKFRGFYYLIESSTGAKCSEYYVKLHEAREKALAKLNDFGEDKLKKAIEHWLSTTGTVDSLPINGDQ